MCDGSSFICTQILNLHVYNMFVAKTVTVLMHSLFNVDAFSLRSSLNVILHTYILKTLFIPRVQC